MVDKEKKVDRIVIGVLIIIILLLLGINACTMMKKGEEKPDDGKGGNTTVLDLKCEKSCKKKGNSGDNTNPGGNGGSNRSGTGNNTGTNTGNDNTDDDDETVYDMLEVYDDEFDTIKWNGSTKLNIFENSTAANNKIAPESKGTYEFDVRNSTDYKLKYDLSFVETNTSNINIKYKLKKNGTYINSDYVTYNELALTGQMVNVGVKDVYELEWKWFSSDNDTNIGTNGASYTLKINISAEGIE